MRAGLDDRPPSQRAQERGGSSEGRNPSGHPRPFVEGVGLAIGKHDGLATVCGVVLVELALLATPERIERTRPKRGAIGTVCESLTSDARAH